MPKNNRSFRITSTLLVLLITNNIVVSASTKVGSIPLECPIPQELKDKLHSDPSAIKSVSTDFGNVVHFKPSSVMYPSTVQDIQTLVKSSYNCSHPFVISARGNGHSVQGESMARDGVVVDMQEFKRNRKGPGVTVSKDPLYADVGGELLWSDVLNGTLKEGVMPVSLTNFLGLSVGGTLSNAGIGIKMFRFGPQISNVYEMDVVTGKGELVTCSPDKNSELFYAVLGGLGQFGIITRARIPLEPAKDRVRWLKILYSDFSSFTKDQESIIAINGRNQTSAVGYLGGEIILDNGTPNEWVTSFLFPSKDVPKILSLVKKYGVIYSLEIADPYDNITKHDVNQRLKHLIKGLNPLPGMVFERDAPYAEFLGRIRVQKLKNESHPWLNLFVPKSRIFDFNLGVIRDILLKRRITLGPAVFYPANKNKWDDRMSAAIPDEDVFYVLSILYTSNVTGWKTYYDQNVAIAKFCDKAGIKYKAYLHSYSEKQLWVKHFGSKWETFEKRKHEFDPKHLLSPGQKIFN